MASLNLLLLTSLLSFFYLEICSSNGDGSRRYAVQYWENHISSELPKPEFLLSKASPLTPTQSSRFSKLIDQNELSTHLSDFCNKANLLCFQHTNFPKYRDDLSSGESTINIRYRIRNRIRYRIHYKDGVSASAKANHKNLHLFFRETMLRPNTIMPMPDITNKMPKLSFLPRPIVSKFPFSTSKINEIKKIFRIGANDTTVADSLKDCEREPIPDENRRCVASIEDMIDFATFILGKNVLVRTMETSEGSNGNIMLGEVKRINGGKLTKSVSCHQTMFPYLLYYCHSIPRVRVYEADILDPVSKAKINHGTAICHVDTSSWSQGHEAFVELGSDPGRIEVCHWIFKSGMIWTIAD